jgi:hypothetical protein
MHFVGNVNIKNDISFVIGAWMALFDTNWFNNVDDVKIWSDGGPKHFKISSNMKFLLAIQQKKLNIQWEYNFFAPYHGCSICDGVAAQAKGALNVSMRDQQKAIHESTEAVKTIGQLKNHQAVVVKPANNDFTTPTLKGIKQFFKFQADRQKNIIYAFKNSSQ